MKTRTSLNVLFISRAYPPVLGGIEKQNYEIARALGDVVEVDLIVNHRGKKFLPIFMVITFFKILARLHRYDVVLLGDGVLAILGFVIKKLSRKPVVCILHGLDVTFASAIYQHLWLGVFLPALDRWIAVGNETVRQGEQRGLAREKFVFIGNGVDVHSPVSQYAYSSLEALLGFPIKGKVLLTLGRLVKRKGVEWFVTEVMPLLSNDITYIIAGEGRQHENIQHAIDRLGLQDRVICLGAVSEEVKAGLLSAADIFVQPNIPVDGDMEGFGLVVLEAGLAGCCVLASGIEGLKDAIHDGKNGILLAPCDALAYKDAIDRLLANPDDLDAFGKHAANYVRQHFSWQSVADNYLEVLQSVVKV